MQSYGQNQEIGVSMERTELLIVKWGPECFQKSPGICSTLSPPTRNRSTAAMLMPCFSQTPESTSLMENPDFTAILLDEPSGRFTQQYLGDLSLSGTNAGNLEVSDLKGNRKVSAQ